MNYKDLNNLVTFKKRLLVKLLSELNIGLQKCDWEQIKLSMKDLCLGSDLVFMI